MPEHGRLTAAARVWNPACYREGENLRDGDRALAAMLLIDGYVHNGGVCQAFDLSPKELAEGIAGYKYFGLDELAALIRPHGGEEEAKYNRAYYGFTVDRNLIWEKFEEMFRSHPERFAPLKDRSRS